MVGGVGGLLAVSPDRRMRFGGAFLREAAVIGALYGLWQLAGTVSLTSGADARLSGEWIARTEHDLRLPSEHTMQHLVLGHRLLVAGGQPVLRDDALHDAVRLPDLAVRCGIATSTGRSGRSWPGRRSAASPSRRCYRPLRRACSTASSTPRCATGSRSTPTASPPTSSRRCLSVQVAWAVLIGWYTWRVSTSRWRYLGRGARAASRCSSSSCTGNHWWLDGAVAAALLGRLRLVGVRSRGRRGADCMHGAPSDADRIGTSAPALGRLVDGVEQGVMLLDELLVLLGVLVEQTLVRLQDLLVLALFLIEVLAVALVQPRRHLVLADEDRWSRTTRKSPSKLPGTLCSADPELVEAMPASCGEVLLAVLAGRPRRRRARSRRRAARRGGSCR